MTDDRNRKLRDLAAVVATVRKPMPPPGRAHTTPKGARGYRRRQKHREPEE